MTSEIQAQQTPTPYYVALVPDREATNRTLFREFLGDHRLMRHDGGFAGPTNLVPFWQAFGCGEDVHTHPSRHAIFPSGFIHEKTNMNRCGWVCYHLLHNPRWTRSSRA